MQAAEFYTVTTTHGEFTLELFPNESPKTVENFRNYVKAGHYSETVFNRVIRDFMIQGGGYLADGTKKRTFDPIPNEATNGLHNLRGTVAMARHPEPHTATCQFFINLNDNLFLDHTDTSDDGFGYCVFGKVSHGWEVIEKIAGIETCIRGEDKNYPTVPVIIQRIVPIEIKAVTSCFVLQ